MEEPGGGVKWADLESIRHQALILLATQSSKDSPPGAKENVERPAMKVMELQG
jgi:hypothetical protein